MSALTEIDPKGAGFSPDALARIEPWMDRLVVEGRLAGLSVTVNRRGRTAFARACGQADLARGTPFTLDTVTRIYSMTKPLTSVAVMQLYEQGLFQLDDPVSRVLPEFADMRVA
ncbi:MAG: beta-lactamase family protein, partial [Actinomycetospora chiangmaiensis]|nr:beta-lactamase family protein [Actinomycetospora chiangmaiensis]